MNMCKINFMTFFPDTQRDPPSTMKARDLLGSLSFFPRFFPIPLSEHVGLS